MEFTGTAVVSTESGLRVSMTERNRIPKAVLKVEIETVRLAPNAGLRDAGLRDPARHVDAGDLPRPSEIWTAHLKLNQTAGTAADRGGRAAAARRTGRGLPGESVTPR
ncbi:hypothetical protein CU254_19900 [Amycolatopsis sp. AA4]|nr:hypothetical protein CU254_19900 [Amycolatopsis sp. AA4]